MMFLNRQVVVSFPSAKVSTFTDDIEEPSNEYLFDLDLSCDGLSISTSISNNTISSYDTETLALQSTLHHIDRINAFECSSLNPQMLFSASSDKCCCIWDKRTPTPIMKLILSQEALSISAGVDDLLVAVASGRSIVFYDVRNGGQKLLGEYSDCHTDDVNMVKFSPSQRSILVSASEDGLICVFDTSVAASDSAVTSILNTECPVRQFEFFGANNEGILSLSTVETASAWHFPSAQRVGNYPNIRTECATDYLVDSWFDESSDTVYLLTGSFSGEGRICKVSPSGVQVVEDVAGGHRDMIRCCSYMEKSNSRSGLLFTGGEDGRLCSWQANNDRTRVPNDSKANGVLRGTHGAEDVLRFKPY